MPGSHRKANLEGSDFYYETLARQSTITVKRLRADQQF